MEQLAPYRFDSTHMRKMLIEQMPKARETIVRMMFDKLHKNPLANVWQFQQALSGIACDRKFYIAAHNADVEAKLPVSRQFTTRVHENTLAGHYCEQELNALEMELSGVDVAEDIDFWSALGNIELRIATIFVDAARYGDNVACARCAKLLYEAHWDHQFNRLEKICSKTIAPRTFEDDDLIRPIRAEVDRMMRT